MNEAKEHQLAAPQPPAAQQPAAQQTPAQQPTPLQTPPQQPNEPQQKTQISTTQQPFYKNLPWLRFWCNLIFYISFLVSFIIGGCKLVKNTKPLGHQFLDNIIETINNSIKLKDNSTISDTEFSNKTKQKDNTTTSDTEFSDKTKLKDSTSTSDTKFPVEINLFLENTEKENISLTLEDYINQINVLDNILKITTIQSISEQQHNNISSLDNSVFEGSVKLFLEDTVKKSVKSHIEQKFSDFYIIKKDNLDNALKAVAMASRQEVSDEYHKSFSILVTILTVFGIGFPIIIALIQHSFNERDLDKIEKTATKANEATDDATKAITNANDAIDKANNSLDKANTSLTESRILKQEYLEISNILYVELDNLFYVLSTSFSKQSNGTNLSIALEEKSYYYKILEIFTSIKNKKINEKDIKSSLIKINNNIIDINNKINLIKNEKDELLGPNHVKELISEDFNECKDFFVKIKKLLPEDYHNEINKVQESIQNGLNLVSKVAKRQ